MSTHVTTITHPDGTTVCLSYGVPVAIHVPGRGYFRTDRRYSVTTSRHMNAFAGTDATEIADADLRALAGL
jgi:hypothetical protein